MLLGSLTEEPQKRVQEEVELPENQARLANPGSQGNPVNQESRVNPANQASLVKESYQREVRYHKKRSKKVKPAKKKKVKIEHTLKKN